jgi:hypothetical protein
MDMVELMLGHRFVMLYHPALPTSALTPQQTLQQSVDTVNNYMQHHGRDLLLWEYGMQDEAARLVNVNVIYQNLIHEPIRKPILVHFEGSQLMVDCGDTRLMALSLCLNPPMVSVIATTLVQHRERYSDWQQINSVAELVAAANMQFSTAQVYYTPADDDADYAVSWLEVGDATTAHHLHSMETKIQMLQNYLNQQPVDFKFSIPWVRQAISWNAT